MTGRVPVPIIGVMRSATHGTVRLLALGASLAATLALAACGGGDDDSSAATVLPSAGATVASGSGATGATATGATASSVPASGTGSPSTTGAGVLPGLGAGGPLDVSTLCAAVPAADVQKLFKDTPPPVTANPGECDWGSGAVTVDIFQNDADEQYYNTGGVVDGTPISGVGDVAQWIQPVPGATVPFLAAHKGSTTITVSPGLEVDQSTMEYTGSSPFFHVPDSAALAYAAAEGQLCNDLFAAMG
jgi:hypothetical protein